jgi:hypothetical protein
MILWQRCEGDSEGRNKCRVALSYVCHSSVASPALEQGEALGRVWYGRL